ncbi:ANTAR domain-containing protein [Streptomyces kanamyceticus]|uniref:ANTAR domain-containing protein n=1 Tax=Streptomyces kanamyceticus TaxID=1967 RepID=Q1EQK4_STRKN|nr:ANTAR domain-containing protein [Streptomyces kanamyceticus]QEU90551.1 ANTAR domain-containing protein [Streptomyces kanamyceticus]BAE95516.1 hypothetical protein [Streptomyces kanamyceticus]
MAFFAVHPTKPLVLLSAAELADEHARLLVQVDQLKTAVTSHATVDQAIGVVVTLGGMPPEGAWRVLRDVSQRTNVKLRDVAEHILTFAQGAALPEHEQAELHAGIARYAVLRSDSAPGTRATAPSLK